MLGKSHLFFGAVTSVATIVYLHTNTTALPGYGTAFCLFGGALVGSLLPDIDLPTSTLGKHIRPISTFLNRTIGHRTWTHDMVFLAILCALSYHYLPLTAGIWFGVFGHLFLDGLTINGLPLVLWNRRIYLLPRCFRVRSDSLAGILLTILLAVLYCFGCYYLGGR